MMRLHLLFFLLLWLCLSCILLLEFLFLFVSSDINYSVVSLRPNIVFCSSVRIFWIAVTLHCLEIQIRFKILNEKGNGRSMLSSISFCSYCLPLFCMICVCISLCFLVFIFILEALWMFFSKTFDD